MIVRNPRLQRHVAEHPTLIPERSAHLLSPQRPLIMFWVANAEFLRTLLEGALEAFRDASPPEYAGQRAGLRHRLLGDVGSDYDTALPPLDWSASELGPVVAAFRGRPDDAATLFVVLWNALRVGAEVEQEREWREKAQPLWTERRIRQARELAPEARKAIADDPADGLSNSLSVRAEVTDHSLSQVR